jgi:hypothetical protein
MEQLERLAPPRLDMVALKIFDPPPGPPKRAQRHAAGAPSPGAGRATAWAQVHARFRSAVKTKNAVERTTFKTGAYLINAPYSISAIGKNRHDRSANLRRPTGLVV